MKTDDNPFAVIVKTIREDNLTLAPVYYRIGNVISVEPLKVDIGGAIQTKEDLLKNNALTYFEVGDNLFLLPIEDEQRYIIVCKVVSV